MDADHSYPAGLDSPEVSRLVRPCKRSSGVSTFPRSRESPDIRIGLQRLSKLECRRGWFEKISRPGASAQYGPHPRLPESRALGWDKLRDILATPARFRAARPSATERPWTPKRPIHPEPTPYLR